MVVGLVNSNTAEKLQELPVNDDWVALYTHDKQSVNKTWWLGLAVILPKRSYLGFSEAPTSGSFSTSFLGRIRVENNAPVEYYAVAAWELSDSRFKDPGYFKNYLIHFINQLSARIEVEIH